MKRHARTLNWLLAMALLATGLPSSSEAKSYSSGHQSYSSHSSSSGGSHSFSSGSHSFSSGGSRSSSSSSTRSSSGGSGSSGTRTSSSGGSGSKSSWTGTSRTSSSGSGGKSFNSGSGKSYTSGSTWSADDRRSYSSSKSYTAGSGRLFSSGSSSAASPTSAPRTDSGASGLTFDTAAARAKKEEVSKAGLTRYKDAQAPPKVGDSARPTADSGSYRGTPPPIPVSGGGSYRSPTYVPDVTIIRTRPARVYTVFSPYYTRPVVIYRDPYDSFFWWWLLDRSLDDRAWWAYHHRYDMDPARYETLMERDQQLEARVAELEAQQVPRDPNYVPPGLDRDLMYSDQYVANAYRNRPTTSGTIAFWVLAVPTATALCGFFIWLIWFKRWQTAT